MKRNGSYHRQGVTKVKIVVCIKQVPDTEAKITVRDGQVSWGDAQLVINPFDEFAVEGALLQKEAVGATVTALCLGPETATDALKHALAMGADEAILVSDPALTNLDSQGAARVLAAAIKKIGDVDLALFGRQSLDEGSGLTPAQTARLLGWPMVGSTGAIKLDAGTVQAERVMEEGRQLVSARMPVVLSVVQSIGEPRYPSFMGIRRASRTEIPVWSLADLGIPAPVPLVSRVGLITPAARELKCEMITGASPAAIGEALADRILAEKVL